MAIAIIVGTHGYCAEQLLKSTEMLLGKQDNTAWVDFVPGENVDTLIEKYNVVLERLDVSQGALFFVDIWGGSPFNAANVISSQKENLDVIAGVNIPMLVETLMARDDGNTFEQLRTLAIETGREGIRQLKETSKYQSESSSKENVSSIDTDKKISSDDLMTIGLARIDDRLIHGQVATRWTKETNVSRIIVISDEVAADNVRSTLLTQVAPPGVTAHVVGIEKMLRVYNNPKYAHQRVMLLFTNPTDVERVVEGGVRITSVNIGGMAFRNGKTQVNNAVSVDKKDIEAFRKLHARGIELEVRKVSNDTRLNMMDLISRLEK